MESYLEQHLNELTGGRGQASGFIMRMMAENKMKHKGQYKNPSSPLDPKSTMKSPVAFDYRKLANANQRGTNSSAYGASPFIMRHFSTAHPVPFVRREDKLRRGDWEAEVPEETDEQKEARLRTTAERMLEKAKELAGLRETKTKAATKIQGLPKIKKAIEILGQKKADKRVKDAEAKHKAYTDSDKGKRDTELRNLNIKHAMVMRKAFLVSKLKVEMEKAQGSPLTEAQKKAIDDVAITDKLGDKYNMLPMTDSFEAALRKIVPKYNTKSQTNPNAPMNLTQKFGYNPGKVHEFNLTFESDEVTKEKPTIYIRREYSDYDHSKRGTFTTAYYKLPQWEEFQDDPMILGRLEPSRIERER